MPNTRVLAADGRVIGARARQTRARLLESTAKLLAERGVLELKVVDVTREVGTSAATFYQYFADVDAAILALVEQATVDEAPLVDLLHDWDGPDGVAKSEAFIDAYVQYWDEHSAVLRVRNLRAEEGDAAFRAERSKAHLLVMEQMIAMVTAGQRAGRLSGAKDPFATAAAVLAMIERLLSYQPELERRGSPRDKVRSTLAAIVYETLTGRTT